LAAAARLQLALNPADRTPARPPSAHPSWLRATTTTATIAITIGSSAIMGLSLVLSVVRSLERGALMGACSKDTGARVRAWCASGMKDGATLPLLSTL
jgi:hypothetical protein